MHVATRRHEQLVACALTKPLLESHGDDGDTMQACCNRQGSHQVWEVDGSSVRGIEDGLAARALEAAALSRPRLLHRHPERSHAQACPGHARARAGAGARVEGRCSGSSHRSICAGQAAKGVQAVVSLLLSRQPISDLEAVRAIF